MCVRALVCVTDNTQSHPLAYHACGLTRLCTEYGDILCAGSDASSPLLSITLHYVTKGDSLARGLKLLSIKIMSLR